MHLVLKIIPKKWLIMLALAMMGLLLVFFMGVVTIITGGSDSSDSGSIDGGFVGGEGAVQGVSEAVLRWEPVLRKHAKEFGVEGFVPLMMAQMMQESGGQGSDPMQSSEGAFNTKYCKKPNCITDPDYSIWAGVQEFKHAIERAGVTGPGDMDHIKTALQAYNFGTGFFDFVASNGGKYTKEIAIKFSQEQYKKVAHTGMYHCLRPEAVPFQACYGDILYVDAVLKYYQPGAVSTGGGKNPGSGGSSGVKVVDVGRPLIGKSTYVFGGGRKQSEIDRNIFDCSSFVHWAFKQIGRDLGPVTDVNTESLNKIGQKISPNDMKAGDVIFFDTYKHDGHVGLVIDKNTFIGCQTNKGVSIEDLNNPYWKKVFSGHVRRF
ncbi:putative endopeptidase YddH (plasmid) [Bacillus cereus]|uniref:bifunctional lytic transglycosylase/C40 family peptidase n=1 Tax=Bacillus cereus TaxID=1396 RepID=UPI001F15BBD6|nr:bifunctional lytic transglycosylase/C40 family peptidase [Bacillus cereus]BCC15061.1 putative endopeptidase YddH [Bacillus cereus]BCD02899.1 putative endopeptidase YddH [Bacillus cereus]